MKRWDGDRIHIEPSLLTQYYVWLHVKEVDVIHTHIEATQSTKRHRKRGYKKKNTIDWIEKLLDKPLDNFRKYCIWRVFVPYFINVKGLNRLDAFNATKTWLDKCNSVSRLDFNAKQKIDEELNRVGSYRHIPRDRLKEENNPLYIRLRKEGVIY